MRNYLLLTVSFFIHTTVVAQAPVVSSFTPTSGGQIAAIVITGSNFTGTTAVSFGGTSAFSFLVNSPTQITAFVNRGSTGDVMVTNPSGSGSLAGFTLTILH
ncbi:MAG: IPT/TIG domain-containing protein [Chitinophagaceae bacterium]